MLRQHNWKMVAVCLGGWLTTIGSTAPTSTLFAAPPERPTFNNTADPRPNILPDWVYNHREPYRLRYNRPPYHAGKALYYVISPTSQEALSWKENLDEGRYNGKDCPPVYKSYMYPKPWEVLNTGPRPTFASMDKPVPVQLAPATVPPNPPPASKKAEDDKKAEEKKAEDKKADDKKSEDKKADDKKSADKQADDVKKADAKKADEAKKAEDVKAKELKDGALKSDKADKVPPPK